MRKGTTLYTYENGKLIASDEIGNVSLYQSSSELPIFGKGWWQNYHGYLTDLIISNYDKYDTTGFENPSRKYLENNGKVTVSSGTYRYPVITTYLGIQGTSNYYRYQTN